MVDLRWEEEGLRWEDLLVVDLRWEEDLLGVDRQHPPLLVLLQPQRQLKNLAVFLVPRSLHRAPRVVLRNPLVAVAVVEVHTSMLIVWLELSFSLLFQVAF